MKDKFKINVIQNKSRTYMLPFLAEQFPFEMFHGLINTYLSFEEGDDIFCIMYQWSSNPLFLKFEGMMMESHLFLGHEDYGDISIYKFKLARAMQEGKEQFIEGNYVKFSPNHKKSIMDYLNSINASNAGRISQILTEGLPLNSDPPNMENETLSNHVKKIEFKPETFVE